MKIISKHFFEMAQQSAKEGVALTTYHAGSFDWDVAMLFLKMAYGYATVEEVERYNSEIAKVINHGNS